MDRKKKHRIVIAFALLVWFLTVFVDGSDTFTDPYFLAVLAIGGVQLGIALWVFRDAQRRGVEEPIIWVVAVIVPTIGLFGLVAYLHYRPTEVAT